MLHQQTLGKSAVLKSNTISVSMYICLSS